MNRKARYSLKQILRAYLLWELYRSTYGVNPTGKEIKIMRTKKTATKTPARKNARKTTKTKAVKRGRPVGSKNKIAA